MNIAFFEKLYSEGKLSDDSFKKIKTYAAQNLLSVHWELKTILYLGILLFTSGLGILVYKNIDTIGHQVILFTIATLSAGCFYYCIKHKRPFTRQKVESPNPFFDYILLAGCLSLITFIGYLQFKYNVFGDRYGLATFIPMIILFISAYYFDHLGILAMAITNLAAWAGIAITPSRILEDNDFNDTSLIFTGTALGVLLLTIANKTVAEKFKEHFAFTYLNFGMHILFISLLAGMFHFERLYLICFIVISAVFVWFCKKAVKERSFYTILIISLYTYIAVSYVMIRALSLYSFDGMAVLYLGCLYFIISGIATVMFLLKMNKRIKIIS
jgi:hypothetical protein